MKGLRCVLIAVCVAFTIFAAGCSGESLKIDGCEWKMQEAISTENEYAEMVAVGAESSVYPEAEIVDVTLSASAGVITVTDNTEGKTYRGTYTAESVKRGESVYRVAIENDEGYAVAAKTEYADGREERTLVVSIGKTTLYFYAERNG